MTSRAAQHPGWHPAAAIAAWLLPGLGHIALGQRQRGCILMVVIGSLWLGGLLIGGISVIDHRHRTEQGQWSLWYFGQAMLAPSVAVNTAHQTLKRAHPVRAPQAVSDPRPLYEPAYGHVMEQGVLYTALAGLLNLLCIIDVLYHDPDRRKALAREYEAARREEAVAAPADGKPPEAGDGSLPT